MITRDRFALNRILAPGLALEEFYGFAASIGLTRVELRNDIRDGRILDGIDAAEAARIAADHGIRVITINALQKFNLQSVADLVDADLGRMIDIAVRIGCPALVLCPCNDPGDRRSPEARFSETVESLVRIAPRFADSGLLGYVEPLGFGISSLSSLAVARDAIAASETACYRILVDTFHYHIGPDTPDVFSEGIDAARIGLVHVSGVETDIPASEFTDAHRILAGPSDRMDSRGTMRAIEAAGYAGDYSFEPFSPGLQSLPTERLAREIGTSLAYLVE